MCWNATSSLIFFIIGTLLNTIILSLSIIDQKYNMIALCGSWYFALIMQLLEYFIWSKTNILFTSKVAYMFNILQITVLYSFYMIVSSYYEVSWYCKFLASLIQMIYIFFCIQWSIELHQKSLKVKTQSHLVYPWWNYTKSFIYLLAFIGIFLLLVRPFQWSIPVLAIILFFMMISYIFYRPYVASMWCFLVIIVPVLAYFIPNV